MDGFPPLNLNFANDTENGKGSGLSSFGSVGNNLSGWTVNYKTSGVAGGSTQTDSTGINWGMVILSILAIKLLKG
jgi:hypothetical protein